MGFVRDVWKIATGRAVAVDIEAEVERRVSERLRKMATQPPGGTFKSTALTESAYVQEVDLGKVFPVRSEHHFVGTGWVFKDDMLIKKGDPFGQDGQPPKDEPDAIITGFKDGWVRYTFHTKDVKQTPAPAYDDKRRPLDDFMRSYRPFDGTLADTLNKLREL